MVVAAARAKVFLFATCKLDRRSVDSMAVAWIAARRMDECNKRDCDKTRRPRMSLTSERPRDSDDGVLSDHDRH